ncbi:MAG: septum formation initiator family protein [Candidatus Levybacteria bacterium]|nr:septum formation initiator family protein [Candidatus Levybacteria bacterium]MBI2189925.1 septum formation initiator family protein [Candidatus Levybacteria bacterium]MBI3092808.1 septum formation initiator family protein [Candidatus Levybacteria bacterium]
MKRVFFIIVLVASLFFINNLTRSIFGLWQKQNLVEKERIELLKAKEENQRLKEQLYRVQSPEFIEEQARNKLLLLKPEEQRILISENLVAATQSGKKRVGESKEVNPDSIGANWKRWWDLFFK